MLGYRPPFWSCVIYLIVTCIRLSTAGAGLLGSCPRIDPVVVNGVVLAEVAAGLDDREIARPKCRGREHRLGHGPLPSISTQGPLRTRIMLTRLYCGPQYTVAT